MAPPRRSTRLSQRTQRAQEAEEAQAAQRKVHEEIWDKLSECYNHRLFLPCVAACLVWLFTVGCGVGFSIRGSLSTDGTNDSSSKAGGGGAGDGAKLMPKVIPKVQDQAKMDICSVHRGIHDLDSVSGTIDVLTFLHIDAEAILKGEPKGPGKENALRTTVSDAIVAIIQEAGGASPFGGRGSGLTPDNDHDAVRERDRVINHVRRQAALGHGMEGQGGNVEVEMTFRRLAIDAGSLLTRPDLRARYAKDVFLALRKRKSGEKRSEWMKQYCQEYWGEL
ncbi:hypothetical protein CORC01_06620 [Colletotrichum orchidophilum]|uniref:Transmembrane protein n=1 Tax=Colletotrichum orchidophilum TaxID=1209926 RepID=A0A1G4B9U0_9PEZI|nr:uncharacterized protein CORC01_06620 [Colletotrichum orchidophilum]OHE98106.1 hypothetical protein CORC01_06620 [Colletotrichum orchidophilum]